MKKLSRPIWTVYSSGHKQNSLVWNHPAGPLWSTFIQIDVGNFVHLSIVTLNLNTLDKGEKTDVDQLLTQLRT